MKHKQHKHGPFSNNLQSFCAVLKITREKYAILRSRAHFETNSCRGGGESFQNFILCTIIKRFSNEHSGEFSKKKKQKCFTAEGNRTPAFGFPRQCVDHYTTTPRRRTFLITLLEACQASRHYTGERAMPEASFKTMLLRR